MQLPHLTASHCHQLQQHNIETIKDLQALLVSPQPNKYQKTIHDLLRGNQQHISELTQVLKSFPRLSLSLSLFSLTADKEWRPLPSSSASSSTSPPRNHFDVNRDVLHTELKIEITVQGSGGSSGEKIFSPRYHKPKTISWWLVLGTARSGELLAMKRIGNVSTSHVNHYSLLFTLPPLTKGTGEETEVEEDYLVFLIPDCIYGIETLTQFRLQLV
jgi:hypothetical protein